MKCLACDKPLDSDYCETEGCLLAGVPQMDEYDRMTAQEYRRQKIVEKAVSAATQVICEHCDGTVEEHNYLDAQVGFKFFQMMMAQINAELLKKDLNARRH